MQTGLQGFPVVQGAQSTTFTTPPLDGSLTVPDLLAFHAVHSSTHTLFAYANDAEVKFIDYATASRAQNVAASIVKLALEAGIRLYEDKNIRPVFGILAVADSVSYATMTLGIQRTGAVPFPISTRNSTIAVAHLLRSTGVRQVFVSEDAAMRGTSLEVVRLLTEDNYLVELLDFPRFELLYSSGQSTSESDDNCIMPHSMDTPGLILHSSGTSAFPKPISISHRAFLTWGNVFYYGEIDACGTRVGVHTAPMFHAIGLIWLSSAICCGIELHVFKPAFPPTVSNATACLEAVVNSDCKWVMPAPSILEEWSKDPQAMQTLKTHVKRILYGGGPLDKDAGDVVNNQGIHLNNLYGTTETGPFCMVLPSDDSRPPEWEYFRLPRPERAHTELIPNNEYDGLSELVLMRGETYSPNVINTSIEGKPGYTTGDLVQEHPTHKGFYKIYGRADEQIMLSTGEKTNPVPLERILLQDPLIDTAVFFGRGRPNNGVLVQPAHPIDVGDAEKVAEFRSAIWPTISAMNAYAPAHSRLLKEMILVAHHEKPLELTAKDTVRRNICLAKYEEEIAALYEAVEDSSHAGPVSPSTWSPESTIAFIREVAQTIMERDILVDDDLFSLGCDSLFATFIRNNIIRALRTSASTSPLAHRVPQSLVYQKPSIRALGDFVAALVAGTEDNSDAEVSLERKTRAMQDMVAKYSMGLPSPRGPTGNLGPVQETVLITGTTGRLGCHLLAQLIQDPKVGHIYALNRASPGTGSTNALLQRMHASFILWGLSPDLLLDNKVTLVVGDYAAEHLGLEVTTYAEIESRLTTIIHNAWRVDFNLEFSSFEPLIAGVRRLIDLAIGAHNPGGARILFVSSLSVFLNAPADRPALEEPVSDARDTVSLGYGESKWVAETMLLRAREAVGLRATAVRVGQLAGDTRIGGWNKWEWVGAIARLGQIVKALPDLDEQITWVPVDIAATALIQMIRSEEPVFNLVAPNPSNWRSVFGTFAKRLNVPLIEYDEWAARVVVAAEANTREEDVQPLALSDFFRVGSFGEKIKISAERACEASPALANMAPIGEKDALLYLNFWEGIGHLHA
ncbi:acetyl-CoA synthetase-like protein [Peniophora sp. CONT]|nr:acetyl-CoA synthetase-like protein [Peniophora sp. CONT]